MADAISKTKGIAIIPIVKALRANPARAERTLPASLQHYLTDHVLASSWYPDEDWLGLLRALSTAIRREQAPDGPWVFFGRSAALRDLADDQSQVPAAARTDTGGVYRQLATGALDPVGLVRRTAKVWSLYHDTGTVEAVRDRQRSNVVIYRLVDYPLACREVFEINRGYLEEHGRLAGVPCKVLSIYATPRRADSWSLDIQFPETPANLASLAKL